jgi:hypothetical protein
LSGRILTEIATARGELANRFDRKGEVKQAKRKK